MKSFSVIKNRLNETWENFSEGWNKLSNLSRDVLIRFSHPLKDKMNKAIQEIPHNNGHMGLDGVYCQLIN
jgi:hypothetical protein